MKDAPLDATFPKLAIAFVVIIVLYVLLTGDKKENKTVGGMNVELAQTQPAPSAR